MKLAAMDSCFDLISPHQHGIANKVAHGLPQVLITRLGHAMLCNFNTDQPVR